MSMTWFRPLMSLFAMGLAISAYAQTPSPSAMPPVQTQGDVTYVSGGIGSDEQHALRSARPNFNLHLLFHEPGGAYLAKIDVVITDDRGVKVLDAFSNGPYFMAKLQPGRYRISVDDGRGRPQVRQVTVPARGAASASFSWGKAQS